MMLVDVMYERLKASQRPLSPNQLFKGLLSSTGRRLDPEESEQCLQELIESGRAYRHPPIRANAASRFWVKSPQAVAEEKLLNALQRASGALTIAQLRKSLVKAEAALFDESLGNLINSEQAWYVRRQSKDYVIGRPPHPCDFLTTAQRNSLQRIVKLVNQHRPSSIPLTIDTVIDVLNGSSPDKCHGARDTDILESANLRDWYHEAQQARGSRMVPIIDTWRRYGAAASQTGIEPDREKFRQCFQRLFNDGLISLEAHERPHTLDDEERSLGITMAFEHQAHLWAWRES